MPPPVVNVAVAAIVRDGRVLLGQRPASGVLAGLWELPGGKLERGETFADACRRECLEELNLTVTPTILLATVTHTYPHATVHIEAHLCHAAPGEPVALVHSALQWVPIADALTYPIPPASRPLLEALVIWHAKLNPNLNPAILLPAGD
jgi:mutator protein MutT